MLKKLFLVVALLSLISACNTVNGIGKDLESAGKAVQNTSKK